MQFACRGSFESAQAERLHKHHVRRSTLQLPAVNTTSFGRCQTVFDRLLQPVPPAQADAPARAILQVVLGGRRERALGRWNKAPVFTDSGFRGVGDPDTAAAASDSQLTDQRIYLDRPANLRLLLDDTADRGAHEIFDRKAGGGFKEPTFLQSLPHTARLFATAVANNRARGPTPPEPGSPGGSSERAMRLRSRSRCDWTDDRDIVGVGGQ